MLAFVLFVLIILLMNVTMKPSTVLDIPGDRVKKIQGRCDLCLSLQKLLKEGQESLHQLM